MPTHDERILIFLTTQKDGERTQNAFTDAGLASQLCSNMTEICREIDQGAGAALVSEEAVIKDGGSCLQKTLSKQPPWSDFPIVLLARDGMVDRGREIREAINATLVERPVKIRSLLSVIRAALRSRRRQYEVRDHLFEQEKSFHDRARLAAIVEFSEDAVISKSLNGEIRSWNAGAERLFGYSSSEVIGQSITLLIPHDRLDEEREIIERLNRGERIEHFETIRLRKDRTRISISLTVSPILDSHGKVVGASKVARDITQRKKTEEALQEADRRKDDFIALLAHELRNPLAPIRNGLEVIRIGRNEEKLIRAREMMDRQLSHMVRLIDDLLDISRINRNKMELRRERILLSDVVNAAIEIARPILDAEQHEFSVTLPGETVYLNADLTRLTQVFGNLLTNSAKYTPKAGVIGLTAKRNGEFVAISVADNGIGIPKESLENIFNMFSQVDRSIERTTGGLGIGLALVKGLVEMHGGTVTVDSDGQDKGSIFTVTLPIDFEKAVLSSESNLVNNRQISSLRILVVDDNQDGADSLAMMFEMMGHMVNTANDGIEALECAKKFHPDVILMDVGMPRMNGLEATKRIRQEIWGQAITIIALTGWGQENDRNLSSLAGCDGHLVKPVEANQLQQLISDLTSKIVKL